MNPPRDTSNAGGKVWLVGAGPGDPDLVTVRGRDLLAEADVVLYDALSHPSLLGHCKAGVELRNVGKRGGTLSPSQSWITEQLITLARAGRKVVRLKGGDSFLFARGAEEAEELFQAGVEFEIVPGLSSPVGTSAYAGIPLTHRELSSSVTFITGSDKDGEAWSDVAWKKLATATDTLCILMGMRRIAAIAEAIIAGGRSPQTPVAVVQWGARPEQRVLVSTLRDVAHATTQHGLTNPAVIIVGEVVSLRPSLAWFERLPLFGKRVLVPRAEQQAAATAKALRLRGAEAVVQPVIQISPPDEPARLSAAVKAIRDYGWVLFTSANGVERFFAEVQRQNGDARWLGNARVGAIGPKTGAELHRYGVRPDLVAAEFVGEALARDLVAFDGAHPAGSASSKRVLLPRAQVAREELPEQLRHSGFSVDVVPAYQTKPLSEEQSQPLRELFRAGKLDAALFTSSSTVSNTVAALGSEAPQLLGSVVKASIGPITTKTLVNQGFHADVTACEYTVEGLLDALGEHYAATTS